MKKVLVITYYWPPSGGPGVQRILHFVNYLPAFGWQPVVLTVRNGEYPEIDESLSDKVAAEQPVHYSRTVEPYTFYRWLVNPGKRNRIPTFVLTEKGRGHITKDLAATIRGNLFIPDAKIGWIPFAVREGLRIARTEDIRLIFSSSPPQTVNLIAGRISKKTRIKWVADLRDPWTDIFYYHQLKRCRWAEKRDRQMERKVLSQAQAVITVSPSLKLLMEKKISGEFHVITNGFDPRAFPAVDLPGPVEKFRVVHTGHLAGNQNPANLWLALSSLLSENPAFRESLSLEFYGRVHSDIIRSIHENQLSENCKFHPYMDHREIVRVMQASSILFFVIPHCSYSDGILTSKLFDYIGARRPVLGIGPMGGDAAGIVRELGCGMVCDYQDRPTVKQLVSAYFEQWQNQGFTAIPTSPHYLNYSRAKQAEQLAAIFDSVDR